MGVRIRLALATLLALSCSISVLMAWGDTGQQLTAKIGGRGLTADARPAIVTLVRGAEDDIGLQSIVGHTGDPEPSEAKVAATMAKMATWPDCMGRNPDGKCKPKGI